MIDIAEIAKRIKDGENLGCDYFGFNDLDWYMTSSEMHEIFQLILKDRKLAEEKFASFEKRAVEDEMSHFLNKTIYWLKRGNEVALTPWSLLLALQKRGLKPENITYEDKDLYIIDINGIRASIYFSKYTRILIGSTPEQRQCSKEYIKEYKDSGEKWIKMRTKKDDHAYINPDDIAELIMDRDAIFHSEPVQNCIFESYAKKGKITLTDSEDTTTCQSNFSELEARP